MTERIQDLKPDPENARKHGNRNLAMMIDSLEEVGAGRSIVIDEDNIVLAGNGLLEAAAKAGIEKMQVVEHLRSASPLGLEFIANVATPTHLTHAPGDFERLFVLEKGGRIVVISNGAVLATPFLDIEALVSSATGETGLLGLAFHPDYQTNGYFYVYYISDDSPPGPADSLLVRYTVTADPEIADPASAQTVLLIEQPTSSHNGGWRSRHRTESP